MRLFTGISISPIVRKNLDKFLQQLRPTADARWSRPDNLHVTTKFIGEWPEESLDDLIDALEGIAPVGKMNLAIRGLGWFPNPQAPRVFWCGIEAPPTLAELALATDKALVQIGIPGEKKTFSPHLTLARMNPGTNIRTMQQAVAALSAPDFGSFTAAEFHLFMSELGPAGSKYTKLADFPLENV